MSAGMQQTHALLAAHHRDGEHFAKLMHETFPQRFDGAFWATWAQWIEPVLPAQPTVLDLGAGPGLFLRAIRERYPEARAVGVECAPWMLEAAGELPAGCELVSEDLHDPSLPLAAGTVDAALASVVLHELNQPVRALQAAARALKPGGRLLVFDWVRAPLSAYLQQQADEAHVFGDAISAPELADLFIHFVEHNRFSREDLGYLLERVGFEVLDSVGLREGRFARIVAQRR